MNNLQADMTAWFMQAGKDVAAGNLDSAEMLYRKILEYDQGHYLTLYNLGFVVYRKGRGAEALELYKRCIVANPQFKEAHYNSGIVLQNLKRFSEAKEAFLTALGLEPNYYEAYVGMAGVYRDQALYDEALENYNSALKIREDAEILTHVGYIYQLRSKLNEAAAFYVKALNLNPQHFPALINLGILFSQVNRYEETQQLYDRALAINPRDVQVINNYGRLYKAMGLTDKAIEWYRKGLAIKPDHVALHNNIMMAMVYADSVSPEELVATGREFDRAIAMPLARTRPFTNDRNPERKLRIGYVSGDLRRHSVSYFIEPLVHRHDRSHFEVYAYSNTANVDEVTARIKGGFDHWREIRGKMDEVVVEMIEADRIDILIDVSGHTEGNRLTVFARKPAPIQVSWLGYPATTGMTAMDYRFVDHYTDPVGLTENLSVEKLWRLPEIFCCYREPHNSPPVIDHPPFQENGYITFGCFNNFSKVTDQVLSTWQKIMERVPGSRLLLEIAGLDSAKYRADVEARLANAGMSLDRVMLELRKPENQFKLYNKIDIALDPFPCNGGTTSMDTLWMGVPFVTLEGRHFVSRMGVTILNNAGMPELIARDINEYVEKAVALAMDIPRLSALRDGLQARVKKSPLMNQQNFAASVDDAYRQMWRSWCAQA